MNNSVDYKNDNEEYKVGQKRRFQDLPYAEQRINRNYRPDQGVNDMQEQFVNMDIAREEKERRKTLYQQEFKAKSDESLINSDQYEYHPRNN
mmetsp:Transcript_14030/g.12393  ORF Transcript_14030/g.12393 Transcript_14030/m.12393 type:complete len:92 (+) Transcript_14030:26-301(+)